jgi:uncharacterized membrane protein
MLLAGLASRLGQVGAALARAGMVGVGFAVLFREVDVGLPKNLWRSVLGALMVTAPLLPIELLLDTSVYVKALVEFVVFAAVLALAYRFVKPLSGEDLELLKAAVPMKFKRGRF